MYSKTHYSLSELPPKTLCLTFDDGPGSYTYDIAKFLNEQKVRATFFVVGKYAYHHPDVLKKVQELGHIIGNHTYEHPDMPYYHSVHGELSYQIIRTDLLIDQYVSGKKTFFRAPYGKWTADVADELNANILSSINHIGPIHWDIAGIDCFYWKNDKTVDETVQKYLDDIREKDHGIIVMHDEIADMDIVKPKNRTLDLVRKLIPILLEQGYTFIGLDEIDSVKKDFDEVEKFNLKSKSTGKFLALGGSSAQDMQAGAEKNDALSAFSMEKLGHGKVALKAANGKYLRASSSGIEASRTEVGLEESFDLVLMRDNEIVFRVYNGNFMHIDKNNGNKLMCSVEFMRQAEIFSFVGLNIPKVKPVSFARRMLLLKKGLQFVKSKVFNQ
jgi:peptidoglycan/xylan/chitin deacetylase (PgdA/CDA1 family)